MAAEGPSVLLLHGSPGELPPADVVVAMTPGALRACAGAVVVDDVIDRRRITWDRAAYVAWQLDWFERLDRAAEAGGALRAAALYLSSPLDSLVVGARQLRALLEGLQPGVVTYLGPLGDPRPDPLHAGHVQFWPRLGDTPLVAQLLPLVAGQLGIAAHLAEAPGDPPLGAPAPRRAGLRAAIGPAVRRLQAVWPPPLRPRGTTLLLTPSGYGAQGFAAGERREGRRTVVVDRGTPATRLFGPAPWGFRPMGPAVGVAPLTGPVRARDDLAPLLREVDAWAAIDGAGEVLAGRVAAVVDHIVPVIRRAAADLEPQLARLGVTRVAATNPSSIEEYAALLAAGRSGIERILLQHGDHLFDYDLWLVTETPNVDELWVSDVTVPDDLAGAASRYGVVTPRFRVDSPRVRALRRQATAAAGNEVVYVPSVLLGDSWLIGDGRFEDTWYHRWQLRLLDLMIARANTAFVWKALPAANQSFDPIPDEIGGRGAGNVRYETGPLVPVLRQAARVFTDFPSTPLYEAVHLGRPTLALSFRRFATLRPAAARLFAPVLRECDTEEEALAAVEAFLDAPADRYTLDSRRVLPT